MKLSDQVLLGLKRLGNQKLVSEDCFKSILNATAVVLEDTCSMSLGTRQTGLEELNYTKPDLVKECYAALLILLVESARQSMEIADVVSILENYNINPSRLKSISHLYEKQKTRCQSSLSLIGSSKPKIIDIKWRLDYCIKSSSLEHEGRPLYFIQIITEGVRRKDLLEEVREIKKLKFTCSLQQLQELVLKLKECARLIQSITHPK